MADITPEQEIIVMGMYAPISFRLEDAFRAREGILLSFDELTRLLAFHEVVAGMLREKMPK